MYLFMSILPKRYGLYKVEMLVFRRGVWKTIDVPLSDPMLTPGHMAAVAAMIANGLSTEKAEQFLYEQVLGISREEHDTPQNEEK